MCWMAASGLLVIRDRASSGHIEHDYSRPIAQQPVSPELMEAARELDEIDRSWGVDDFGWKSLADGWIVLPAPPKPDVVHVDPASREEDGRVVRVVVDPNEPSGPRVRKAGELVIRDALTIAVNVLTSRSRGVGLENSQPKKARRPRPTYDPYAWPSWEEPPRLEMKKRVG